MNPFVFHRPVGPGEVIGRQPDAAALLDAVEGGVNATLYAPRRFGKTSLLSKVLADASVHVGMAAISVDCYGVLTREDFAARVAGAYRVLPGRLGRRIAEIEEGAEAGVQIAGTGSRSARGRPVGGRGAAHRPAGPAAAVLERTGGRTVVAFDEFQAVADVPGLEGCCAAASSTTGRRPPTCSPARRFPAGALFNDRSRPLYGQSRPMRLGRLPAAETLPAIAARFEATGRTIGAPCSGGWWRRARATRSAPCCSPTSCGRRPPRAARRPRRAGPGAGRRARPALGRVRDPVDGHDRERAPASSPRCRRASRRSRATGATSASSAPRARRSRSRPSCGAGSTERVDDGMRIVDPLLARWVTELRGR